MVPSRDLQQLADVLLVDVDDLVLLLLVLLAFFHDFLLFRVNLVDKLA